MNIPYKKETSGFLDITFGPKWDYIPMTRNYIENFLLLNMVMKKNIHQVMIGSSELLENAVKHSTKEGIRLIIDKKKDYNEIEIKIYNKTNDESAKRVLSLIRKMSKSDPFEYYIMRMKKRQSVPEKERTLGLARVYYESNAMISADYKKNESVLEIRAVYKLI